MQLNRPLIQATRGKRMTQMKMKPYLLIAGMAIAFALAWNLQAFLHFMGMLQQLARAVGLLLTGLRIYFSWAQLQELARLRRDIADLRCQLLSFRPA
jgi:hypothetical protein